jgi:hypothetical protein
MQPIWCSFIVILTLMGSGSLASGDSGDCSDDARVRIMRGDRRKAERLYAPIMGKFPSWDKNFHEEIFIYVGSLKNGIEVAWLQTSWGASTCRGTNRLMLFQKGKYIGSYGVDTVEDKIRLIGNKIVFPYKPEIGNLIDLSGPIPKEILLGGQLPNFMPAGSSQ